MTKDFAVLYYDKISKGIAMTHRDIYEAFSELLKSKGLDCYVQTRNNQKNGKILKMSYISSHSNSTQFHWRITVNFLGLGADNLLTIGMCPEAREFGLIANKTQVSDLAIKDIEYIRQKIGNIIQISIGNSTLTLNAFSYSEEKYVDIGNWTVNLVEDKSIKYSDFTDNSNDIIAEMKKKKLNFRLINLSTRDFSKNSQILKSEFSKLGTVLDSIFDASYATKISQINQDSDVMNIILSETNQSYFDSKEFFLGKGLPFQHIKNISKFSNNDLLRNMILLEIIKKMYEQELYLKPDVFRTEPVAGFIYLDDTVYKNIVTGDFSNFLNISYIFTDSKDYTSEKIFSYSNSVIPFYSSKSFIEIKNTETLANIISEDAEIGIDKGKRYDIIVTKMMKAKNVSQIVSSLSTKNIIVNKVIFVSNNTSRFADNFTNLAGYEKWKHPYKILADNIAVVKLATKSFLLPQMFSSLIRILYPLDAKISSEDVKKVIWLNKKRLYRIYSLPNMTLLEPVVVRRNNKDFLANGDRKFYWLRHLI
jgi:hypothetical protein